MADLRQNAREDMTAGRRMRATYEFGHVDHLYRTEFYIWDEALARWKSEGLPDDWRERNLFNFDPPGRFDTAVNLGWCEPPFIPAFEDKVIETHGDYEIIQDIAGRWLTVFTGRRHGFMPDYIKHPVTNMADWEVVAERLNPEDPARWDGLSETVRGCRAQADEEGGILTQRLIGGYMYLRALMGPEDLLYMVHDQPEVIEAAMRGWFDVMDAAMCRVQAEVEIDEVFIAEDICYNHGLLISPDSMRRFLLPYYGRLLSNARARQTRMLHFQVDTDGDCRPAIPLYRGIGMTAMSPFEVASGCDVVEIARQYPDLIIMGGIDKRVLAAGKEAIEAHLQHIIPFMLDRGGYYPMCDHGVPDNVSLDDYLYYRRRICELDHR
jgi:uroporphyrinogen-III decarboxylase